SDLEARAAQAPPRPQDQRRAWTPQLLLAVAGHLAAKGVPASLPRSAVDVVRAGYQRYLQSHPTASALLTTHGVQDAVAEVIVHAFAVDRDLRPFLPAVLRGIPTGSSQEINAWHRSLPPQLRGLLDTLVNAADDATKSRFIPLLRALSPAARNDILQQAVQRGVQNLAALVIDAFVRVVVNSVLADLQPRPDGPDAGGRPAPPPPPVDPSLPGGAQPPAPGPEAESGGTSGAESGGPTGAEAGEAAGTQTQPSPSEQTPGEADDRSEQMSRPIRGVDAHDVSSAVAAAPRSSGQVRSFDVDVVRALAARQVEAERQQTEQGNTKARFLRDLAFFEYTIPTADDSEFVARTSFFARLGLRDDVGSVVAAALSGDATVQQYLPQTRPDNFSEFVRTVVDKIARDLGFTAEVPDSGRAEPFVEIDVPDTFVAVDAWARTEQWLDTELSA